VTPHVLPPAPPTNLTATPGDTIATLQWTAASGATSYNIYRGTSSGQETLLHSGVTTTPFGDTGLTDGTTYYYEVTSVDAGGEGARSSEVVVTPHVLPPLPPTNLTATPGDTIATLQWTAAQGATSYNIYRGTSSGQETLLHSGVTAAPFGDTGLTDGQTYYYEVTSVNTGGESARSSEVTVSPHVLPPSAPTNLTGTIGNGQVGLTWTTVPNALTYNIYRSTSSGNEVLDHQGVIGNSFNDTGLTNGVAYYYQVSAVNGAGESDRSPQISAIPLLLPAAPASLVATALNFAQIKLQWSESSTSLTGFQVLRSTDGVHFSVLTTLDPTATNFIDSGNLVSGTTYYYQVVAMNSAGNSGPSNTAHAAVVGQVAPGWTDADIGGPAIAGSASFSGGVFTVAGGGSDIWYSADQFNYVYQSLNGNGTIIAQVLTQGNTNPWAMAGVMIRNSVTDKGSAYADMVLTPGNGAAFQYRATADTSNLGNDQAAGSAPDWVKLTRSGQTITGYVSFNGVNWTEAGSYTFAAGTMNTQIYIGLAVTAFNNSQLSTATFANVSISGQAIPATPTNLTANAASGTSAALQWQDSDSSIFEYYVYRENPGASSYTMIATLPGNVTNLTDTGLTSGATYGYQVVAVNSAGDSSAASASVTLPGTGGGDANADSLVVTSTSDSGVGSLRQAILNADALPGATQTITFALPSGSQTIDLLSPLPASSVALVAQLDATQNVTVEAASQAGSDAQSASVSILESVNTLTKTGAGTLTIAGVNNLSGSVEVDGGSLTLNGSVVPVSTQGDATTVGSSGTLELAGSVSDLNSNVNISNNSTAAAGILVSGNNQVVGGINGTGNLVVAAGGDLTANSIVQNSLVIGAGATLTIAPSGGSANASAATATGSATAATSTLSPAATARLAAVRAARLAALLAASSVSTSDADISLAAVATPTASLANAGTAATPVIQPLAASQATASDNDAPAVATTSIVASTDLPVATPGTGGASGTQAVSLPPSNSQPTTAAATNISATVAIAPVVPSANVLVAAPTVAPSPSVIQISPPASLGAPMTAVASTFVPNEIGASKPVESLTSVPTRMDFGAAIPNSAQIAFGPTSDHSLNEPDAAPSVGVTSVADASGSVFVSQSMPITALRGAGIGSDNGAKSEDSIDAGDPTATREAIDAIFADGDVAGSNVDDPLLFLLADEISSRK